MKRTVSWLTKLFVSSVVAMALVITLGVQQAQAGYTGDCCNPNVYLNQNEDYCSIGPSSGYSAVVGNYSQVPATVIESFDGPGGHSETISISPRTSEKVKLDPNRTERFILRSVQSGSGVNFRCGN